uniref:Fibronectin type-II domain-containing protein n=1 Tax=Scleropages formosus TaxID=113540 RepID=A0A8C9SM06_SCLFO
MKVCLGFFVYWLKNLYFFSAASWQTKVKGKNVLQDISPDYCVFPFKYKDHWYYSCTSVDSKHKRLWCSLTTDFDKDHLCSLRTDLKLKSSCVFPFIAGGKTYNHCTTDYWFPGISWCSTTANYDGDKKWVTYTARYTTYTGSLIHTSVKHTLSVSFTHYG